MIVDAGTLGRECTCPRVRPAASRAASRSSGRIVRSRPWASVFTTSSANNVRASEDGRRIMYTA